MCTVGDGIILGMTSLCALYDIRKREIPVLVLLIFSILSIFLTLLWGKENWSSLATGFLIGLCFFGISKVTREAIGYGDSWIITILGSYLGGEQLVRVLFAASVSAGLVSLFKMWRQGWKREGELPFVPFIVLGIAGVLAV